MGHDPSPEGLVAITVGRRGFITLLGGAATWPLAAHRGHEHFFAALESWDRYWYNLFLDIG
jgi:hypothetical protein